MLLAEIARTSALLAAESSRGAKRDLIARLIRTSPEHAALVVDYLTARPRQRRTGVGWRSLRELPPPASAPSLTVDDVDAALDRMAAASGPGSDAHRRALLAELMASATADEQALLRGVLAGEIRHGALEGVVADGVARAAEVPMATLQRATMLSGSLSTAAAIAMREGIAGLEAVGLTVGTPVGPMLASSSPSVAAAMTDGTPVAVEAKVDGVRVQVHRDGDDVRVFSRTLDDITERTPEIVAAARALPVTSLILDGEAVTLDAAGRPHPFQVTGARSATRDATIHAGLPLHLFAFDVLHRDGDDLIDSPLRERLDVLGQVAGGLLVPRVVTADPEEAAATFTRFVAAGFEGVVVKDLDAPYGAGRRGRSWRKVKPVHTLDLVVLGVEWGSGRRTGMLSNIHLGARDSETGGFVMVGKTFKGITDAMLAWQTERFLALETAREDHVVWVRPEQVVEIAFDGVQRSRRYPGGAALRFARVLRYRDDKGPQASDTIAAIRSYLEPHRDGTSPAAIEE